MLGIAQTGTGKTASFVLPMLTQLEKGRARARMPRTLILEPTRELAAQVEENFVKYGKNHRVNISLLIGGVSFDEQDRKLQRGADVLIATPGRLLDHFERGKLLLTGVEILVIDEADRMLDMGFIPDIERICKLIPFTRQTLFFSATMPPEITKLTEQFLHAPVRIEVAKASSTATTVTQRLIKSGAKPWDKRATLRDLIRAEEGELKNAIIFCNRKVDVSELFRSLLKHDFDAGALHVVHEGLGEGAEKGIEDVGRDGDHEAGGGGNEAGVNAFGNLRGGGVAPGGGDLDEGVDQAEDGPEEADERGHIGDGEQYREVAFQFGNFQLAGFLDDFLEVGPGGGVPDDGGMDDPGDRSGGAGAFMERLGVVAVADQIAQAVQEIFHIDLAAVEMEIAFQCDGNGQQAATKEQPHQRSAFEN